MPETLPRITPTAFVLEGITTRDLATLGDIAEKLRTHRHFR